MLALLFLALLGPSLGEAAPQDPVGAPVQVDILNEDQQGIVSFAFAQLSGGDACYGQVVKVHNFKQQVVAGTRYTFDLEVGPNTDKTGCEAPAGAPTSQVCHMAVAERVWENLKEVRWDEVNCTRAGVVVLQAKPELKQLESAPGDVEAPLGAPTDSEVNQQIVDFALAQLSAGDECRSKIVQVKNFKNQVVAGALYSFDLEITAAETTPKENCPNLAEGKTETCHLEVWEKVWEDYREVQWDSVNCTRKSEVRKTRQAPVGAPDEVKGALTPEQQAIVDFAFTELAGGGTKCKSKIVKVENFKSQVVAGTRYTFDLVLGLASSPDCPAFAAAADKTETCRMVVWEKVWENYKEVQWDEVDCPSAKNKTVKEPED